MAVLFIVFAALVALGFVFLSGRGAVADSGLQYLFKVRKR